MRKSVLTAAIVAALPFATAHAQASSEPVGGPETTPRATVPLSYVGTDTRLSLGIDDDANILGELLRVFGNDGDSAWLAEGWLGQGGAGGVKLDYHWLWGGKTRQDSIDRPDSVTVAKAFAAIDQNVFDDRKATLGIGFERERWQLDTYVSAALTGKRLADTFSSSETSVLTGTDNGRPYRQEQTVTTITDWFEHPYDWGVGARAGRFFEPALTRLRGGLDYERGDFDSTQLTASLGLDKYFRNSGHSLSVELEHYERDGQDGANDDSDTRAWLLWRYEIGESFRPTQMTRAVQVTREAPAPTPAEPVVMRNEARIETDAMFALDRAELSPEARAELEQLIATIKSDRRVSRVSVIGHTCDLGSEAYNQKLSERRAQAVRDLFEKAGIDVAELDVSGEGEIGPKFPNDSESNRRKNRRVDVSFLTVETTTTTPEPVATPEPTIEWVREPVAAPAPWIERALRNPAEHKRTVDVYRFARTRQETTLGPREFLNRGPIAVNDTLTLARDAAATPVAVLANDSDPDGDALTITTVGTPANGTASIAGTAVNYTPRAGFVGTDSFTYSISDGRGGTAQATVTVTVSAPPPPANRPPVALDDSYEMIYNDYIILEPMVNDSDPDGDPIQIVAVSTPTNGTVRINGGVNILYIPTWRWWGQEHFTYTIRDSHGNEATATIRIRVIDD